MKVDRLLNRNRMNLGRVLVPFLAALVFSIAACGEGEFDEEDDYYADEYYLDEDQMIETGFWGDVWKDYSYWADRTYNGLAQGAGYYAGQAVNGAGYYGGKAVGGVSNWYTNTWEPYAQNKLWDDTKYWAGQAYGGTTGAAQGFGRGVAYGVGAGVGAAKWVWNAAANKWEMAAAGYQQGYGGR